jgi:hypothetical protein
VEEVKYRGKTFHTTYPPIVLSVFSWAFLMRLSVFNDLALAELHSELVPFRFGVHSLPVVHKDNLK